MITFERGDILSHDAEALVNTVNCVGVMGRGVALQFKNRFPENFKAYKAACDAQEVQPGKMFVFETGRLVNPRYISNFPTKRHWRSKSRIRDIESGLKALVTEVRQRGIRSIAVPPLGSGLGGLKWQEVRERIVETLGELEKVSVAVYEPMVSTRPTGHLEAEPRMTAGRAALVGLTDRYLRGLLDPFVTLLEIHKLMYFMQEAGEPLRLKYQAGPYGPYAENLRHVLRRIEGHFITGYADGGDAPDKELAPIPEAVAKAEEYLRLHETTRERFARVVDLVDGFESPFGLELLATVHWITQRDRPATHEDLVARVYSWSPRKQQFTSRQIGLATELLGSKGWA